MDQEELDCLLTAVRALCQSFEHSRRDESGVADGGAGVHARRAIINAELAFSCEDPRHRFLLKDLAARAQKNVSCAPLVVVTHEEGEWLRRALTDAVDLLLGVSSWVFEQKAVMRFFTKSVTTKGLNGDSGHGDRVGRLALADIFQALGLTMRRDGSKELTADMSGFLGATAVISLLASMRIVNRNTRSISVIRGSFRGLATPIRKTSNGLT
ncbi:hypothetical protein E4U25_006439 [Claviceps purpurea]|nr:hypothetical protein E4U25_006439 [Claviceps purpurea]